PMSFTLSLHDALPIYGHGEAWCGVYNGSIFHWTEKGGEESCTSDGEQGSLLTRVLVGRRQGGSWLGAFNGLWQIDQARLRRAPIDRKSTRLSSSHDQI